MQMHAYEQIINAVSSYLLFTLNGRSLRHYATYLLHSSSSVIMDSA